MEQKKCKNKKCKRLLPEDYKYKYCENCRNKQMEQSKKLLGLVFLAGGTVVSVITKGKINPNKK